LDVLIPTPKLDIQRKLVAEMQAAREARKQKLREADELLAGLDAYLLETLGLTPPARSFRLAYAVRLKDARRRFDPDFHSAKFRAIRESIDHGRHPAESVLTLCSSIQSGFAAGKHDQAFDLETGVPHLRPLNLNIYGELSLVGTKFVPKASVSASDLCVPGEVLFNNTNSTELVGKSAVFDLAEPCACSNHITRLRVRTDLNAHYLATVFNALRSIGYLGLLSTNFNNQAGINIDTLSELRLPVPPKGLQQQIATEVRRRREQARRLRGEAEADWQGAKRRFEQQLLGTEQQ
jgi:type I restriction enzyme S subunit